DSFAGAFLARYLSGSTALEAAHFATNISAWVIEQLGARPKPDAHLRAILRRPNSASSTGTEAGNL
ncbi:MAG: PfkB family carbohydrate kinase, partial [Ilumatobacteraceae bacterium]